jgi:hypothetical protein
MALGRQRSALRALRPSMSLTRRSIIQAAMDKADEALKDMKSIPEAPSMMEMRWSLQSSADDAASWRRDTPVSPFERESQETSLSRADASASGSHTLEQQAESGEPVGTGAGHANQAQQAGYGSVGPVAQKIFVNTASEAGLEQTDAGVMPGSNSGKGLLQLSEKTSEGKQAGHVTTARRCSPADSAYEQGISEPEAAQWHHAMPDLRSTALNNVPPGTTTSKMEQTLQELLQLDVGVVKAAV